MPPDTRIAAGATALSLFAVSAIYGFVTTNDCEDAKRRHVLRALKKQRSSPRHSDRSVSDAPPGPAPHPEGPPPGPAPLPRWAPPASGVQAPAGPDLPERELPVRTDPRGESDGDGRAEPEPGSDPRHPVE